MPDLRIEQVCPATKRKQPQQYIRLHLKVWNSQICDNKYTNIYCMSQKCPQQYAWWSQKLLHIPIYFFIFSSLYISSNLCLLSQKYVNNFAINLELVLHLSMSGRSNWIDALLHFCFVGHWAWHFLKSNSCIALKFLLQCHKLAVRTPSNKKILKSLRYNS